MTTGTSTPSFDAARSAAIRQLLIQTVEAAPSRRPSRRFAMVAALTGLALALAGGTAALAFSGAIHFGAPDVAPAPVVPSSATPTPTPTPTATETPLVQSAPIVPHDVDALPARTRWALDLPGADDGCTGTQSYSLSDGRALYLTGTRPKEYEGSDCVNETHEDLALTLVDTSNGTTLWTREWTFDVERNGLRTTDLQVLGTSGRAFIRYGSDAVGPHEVVDLRTGGEVAPFTLRAGGLPRQDEIALPDDSGDVIVLRHNTDSNGLAASDDVVTRVNPLTPDEPKWTVTLPASSASLDSGPAGMGVIAVSAQWHDGWAGDRLLDMATGSLISGDTPFRLAYSMRDVLVDHRYQPSVASASGYDARGRNLWNLSLRPETSLSEVLMPGAEPGRPSPAAAASANGTGAGLFTLVSTVDVALVDETTGRDVWRVPRSSCTEGSVDSAPLLDTVRNAIVIRYSTGALCSYSADTGRVVSSGSYADQSVPSLLSGARDLYGYSEPHYSDPGEPGSAWDLATGKQLWTLPRASWLTIWEFDGGYLVSRTGTHLESIG